MQVLVGADNGGRDLRPLEQFDMTLRDEIRIDLGTNFAGAVRIFFGEPDPLDSRVARRHLATEQPHAARADDGEADALRLPSQMPSA